MGAMTLEKFGDIIDGYLKSIDAQMLIEMPEGTLDVQVQDNTGLGTVIQFYILLNTIKPIAVKIREDKEIDGRSKEWAKTVDGLLGLVRNELLEDKG